MLHLSFSLNFLFKVCCFLYRQNIGASIIQNYEMLETTAICIGLLINQILLIYFSYCYLLILGKAFNVRTPCFFLKFQFQVTKILWNNFCCIVFLFTSAQKFCLRFSKLYFEVKILIFLSLLVSFCPTFSNKK